MERPREGKAENVRDSEELRRLSALPLRYWELGPKAHWIRIVAIEVTGSRIDRLDRVDATP
jgi:hypothetical protein